MVIPGSVRLAAKMAALAPNLTASVLAEVNRWLPQGRLAAPGPARPVPMRGEDLPLSPAVRAATVLNERAADRNNER